MPKTGRPPSDNPKNEMLRIRVTEVEKQEIMDFAKKHGLGLLDLIRIGMDAVKTK